MAKRDLINGTFSGVKPEGWQATPMRLKKAYCNRLAIDKPHPVVIPMNQQAEEKL